MSALSLGIGALVETVGKVATDLITTDKERGELELRGRELDQRVDLAQTEVNKAEATNPNWFVSGWRPAAGWTCVGGLAYQVVFRPIAGWVMTNAAGWSAPPSLEIDTLMTLLFGMLGLGAYRTAERLRGRA